MYRIHSCMYYLSSIFSFTRGWKSRDVFRTTHCTTSDEDKVSFEGLYKYNINIDVELNIIRRNLPVSD